MDKERGRRTGAGQPGDRVRGAGPQARDADDRRGDRDRADARGEVRLTRNATQWWRRARQPEPKVVLRTVLEFVVPDNAGQQSTRWRWWA